MSHDCLHVILFFCVGLHITCINSQNGPCIDEHPHGCCPETVWNETLGRCTACEPGYIGEFCNESCEYPYHGWNCKEMCSCNRSMCHYLTGCQSLETSTSSNKNASDMELLVNDSVLTTSLEAVTSNKATTVDHNISSQKMENIGKEPVIRLGIEHKLMIVFSLLLMSVLIAYLIVTFYEYSMSYETYEHSHIVYYSEGSIVNFRL